MTVHDTQTFIDETDKERLDGETGYFLSDVIHTCNRTKRIEVYRRSPWRYDGSIYQPRYRLTHGAFGVGYLLYRKTRVVRDHEWQRSRAVKSVGGHFRAEESGVWEKDVVMDTNLSMEAEANLKGKSVQQ